MAVSQRHLLLIFGFIFGALTLTGVVSMLLPTLEDYEKKAERPELATGSLSSGTPQLN